MKTYRQHFAVSALLVACAKCAIVQDGIWSGKEWYDVDHQIGVRNGKPYSNDADVQRRLTSPLSRDGNNDNYLDMANVQRVKSFFTQESWNVGFPLADPVYTYDNFLKAVGKFPAFCGESNLDDLSLEETCKREVATLFAHWGQETGKRSWAPQDGEFWQQGLYHIEEMRCKDTWNGTCDYKSSNWSNDDLAWPSQNGVQYYGRGPMQLSWNYNYGQFSNIFVTSAYDSRLALLEDPARLNTDGWASMAAGLWFYMTPQDPKPSIHDVMTGFFEPNDVDLANNIGANFATTTNIINGGMECGQGIGSNDAVEKRGTYFNKWLEFFGMPGESDTDCGNQPNLMPEGGAGDVSMYFDKGSVDGQCQLVWWMTQYSAVARDDYKRCVCAQWGNGAEDCPQGEDDHDNEDEVDEESEDEQEEESSDEDVDEDSEEDEDDILPPIPDEWTTWQTLQEIRDNPHYSPDNYSRTLYQVDRELDFIEQKLIELYTVAI